MQKFGVALMKVEDLDRSKLKARSPSPVSASQKPEAPVKVIPVIQLKKVDREKQKKEEESKDTSAAQQVKLRPTAVKAKAPEGPKDSEQEVPWMASLEKKRKAVMESENKAQKTKESSQATSATSLPPPVMQKPKKSSVSVQEEEQGNYTFKTYLIQV